MNHSSIPSYRLKTLAAVLALALAGSAQAAQPQFRFAQNPVDGQYIVVLKDDAAALASERSALPQVAVMARQMASQHGAQVMRSYSHVLRGFAVRANDQALERLLLDQRVAYVEEDGYVSINATQSNATWGIDRTDQRDLPLSGTYTYNTTATNVRTYIVDTGVLGSHTEFTGRMIAGYTAISDGNGTTDCNGHGTHVAGTVAGTTYGIAKGALISPVRVLDCAGSGTNSGVIAGMDWVVANHVKPAVANMSLGGGASTSMDDAIKRMTDAGVTVAVAAGNDNADACNYSPARAPSAITVGSTTSADARSSFSNWGSCLDIFAPGSSILSAWHTSTTATNTISGTSMASPHAAGVAALYLADNPAATPSAVTTAVLNASTINKVTSPGTNSPNRLLYSLFSTSNKLSNGVAVTGLAASTGNSLNYTMDVPSSVALRKFVITGGTGDADMYVRFGSEPTDTAYDCRPYLAGNEETCNMLTLQTTGTYYIRVKAYSTFSGVSLTGSHSTSLFENLTDYAINDNATVESPLPVSGRSGSAPSTLKVGVTILHTYIGDLKVDLIAPDGSVYVLHNRTGTSTDNIITTYTVDASTEAANGTWKLRVNDNAAADTGKIDKWSLQF